MILAENSIAYAQRSFCVGLDACLSLASLLVLLVFIFTLKFLSDGKSDEDKLSASCPFGFLCMAEGKQF